ncbi:GNAT family N-acetyltransferase [Arsenicicoccus piscis]|nr:GNAT family N-acetyltransferase [Arsenicicoccus piscis]MCH8628414.1 GNAT family N-acetyltransferase [Arsenicicoccus piscis]
MTSMTPSVADLPRVLAALASFQTDDDGPPQLHPGDVGWGQKDGAAALAHQIRVWEREGDPVVIGVGDASVMRLAVSPTVAEDEALAVSIADDLAGDGVIGGPVASAEVRYGGALRRTLHARGWTPGDAWACFTRDLSRPVPAPALRVEVVDGASGATGADAETADEIGDETVVRDVVAAHLAAWHRSTFSVEKFRAMAAGPAFRRARFLVLHADDAPVATACVWSAGPERPGLIEPLGVGREHRGHGHGRAIVDACAWALRELGASSMRVATPVTQWPAVPLYAATMRRLPDVPDFVRPARERS